MTASFLQASLFTSVVAFGVAAMAIAIGVLFMLIGLGIRDVANRISDLASRAPATTRGGPDHRRWSPAADGSRHEVDGVALGHSQDGGPIRRRHPRVVPLEAQGLVEDWRIEHNAGGLLGPVHHHPPEWSRNPAGCKWSSVPPGRGTRRRGLRTTFTRIG
jgi:hypothetical protein